MEKLTSTIFFLILIFGCSQPSPVQQKLDTSINNLLDKIENELNTLGEWEISSSGDSLWVKTTHIRSYNKIMKVQENIKPYRDSISEIYFNVRKYDSIPFPSDYVTDRSGYLLEKRKKLNEWTFGLLKLINAGGMDYDGKKLK